MSEYIYNKIDDIDVRLESYKSLINGIGQDRALSFTQENLLGLPTYTPEELFIFINPLQDESENYITEKNTQKNVKTETRTENELRVFLSAVLTAIKKYISGTSTRLDIEKKYTDKAKVDIMYDDFSMVSLATTSKSDFVGYLAKVRKIVVGTSDELYTLTNTTTMKDALLDAMDSYGTTAASKKNKKRNNAKKNKSASTTFKQTICGYLASLEALRNGFSRDKNETLTKRRIMNSIIRATNVIIKAYKKKGGDSDSSTDAPSNPSPDSKK